MLNKVNECTGQHINSRSLSREKKQDPGGFLLTEAVRPFAIFHSGLYPD